MLQSNSQVKLFQSNRKERFTENLPKVDKNYGKPPFTAAHHEL